MGARGCRFEGQGKGLRSALAGIGCDVLVGDRLGSGQSARAVSGRITPYILPTL